jgi:succinoglycan biosynthesis protein ExoA
MGNVGTVVMMAHPTVSIVLPTLDERRYIRDCLDSLAAQDLPSIVEILVCDGGSKDGTRAIVEGYGGKVRLLDNPGVTAAAGMNVGIDAAVGDIVCRADAHTLYATDYVRRCVAVLQETGAQNAGGPMRPVGTTNFGRAVAAVTSSPLGVGPGKFHYSTTRDEVDTVYLGCWWRETLLELGGYDQERLQWAAEDQELNWRLRQRGGRIVLDPTIRSSYFCRGTPRALARQYRNYGLAKASTLAKHGGLPTLRPLAPACLVLTALALPVLPRPLRRLGIAALAAWAGMAGVEATRLGRSPGVAPHRAFGAIAICHWTYGVGFLHGLGRLATGRPFDVRPKGR